MVKAISYVFAFRAIHGLVSINKRTLMLYVYYYPKISINSIRALIWEESSKVLFVE